MTQLPISPQTLQTTAHAAASQGGTPPDPASDGGSDGGTFNNVLARQMANAQPAKPANGSESQTPSSSSPAPAATSTPATATSSGVTAPTQPGTMATGLPLISGITESNQKSTKTSDVPTSGAAQAGAAAAAALGLSLGQMPLRPEASPVQTDSSTLQQRVIQARVSSASRQTIASGLQPLAMSVSEGKTGQAANMVADSGKTGTSAGGSSGDVLQMATQWAHAGASSTALQAGVTAAVAGGAASTTSPLTDAAQVAVQKTLDASTLSQAVVAGPVLSQSPVAAQQLSVATQVGSTSAWSQDLGQKITWMVSGTGQNSAEIQLNPPDLGPLNVVLHVSGGQATAFFTSPHEAVREAVNHALPRLKEMFAENGIMLGNASVSDQSHQGAGGGAARQFFQQAPASIPGSVSSGVTGGSRSGSVSADTGRVMTSSGLVDTFA